MLTLALESSCDETAVAILRGHGELLASCIASQADLHNLHGGVVPELASRNHLEVIQPLVEKTLAEAGVGCGDLTLVAATTGPGLAPALLVGASFAKGLAIALGRPFLAVNHIEGHLLSPFFGQASIPKHISLIVSGGHTLLVKCEGLGRYEVIGRTRDDAAGEAFDKGAKMLGLPYPGGLEMDRLAAGGNARRYAFPRSMLHSGDLDFSFSGLKTSLRYELEKHPPKAEDVPDLCASFREAIVNVLCAKALQAATGEGCGLLAVSGGVSSNQRLREMLSDACAGAGIEVRFAPGGLRTDNAAMIAYAASLHAAAGESSPLDTDINPGLAWLKAQNKIEQKPGVMV